MLKLNADFNDWHQNCLQLGLHVILFLWKFLLLYFCLLHITISSFSSRSMTLSEDLTTILNHIQKKRDIWHCNKIINPKCDCNMIHKSEDRKITKAIILYQQDIIPEEWWLRNVYCKYIWFSIRNMSILIRINFKFYLQTVILYWEMNMLYWRM